MSAFRYVVYGLQLSSVLRLPELVSSANTPYVWVEYGHVPERLENPTSQGVCYQVSPNRFLLSVEHIARLLVSNGSEILIDRGESEDDDVKILLLESVFGALLYQRGVLPLHASVIETEKGAVAFAGPVGCGKSTLAAAFYQRGYRVIADDLCAVSVDPLGQLSVNPAFPQLYLWADALEQLNSPIVNLRRTRPGLEKYALPVPASFSCDPIPLYALYELHATNTTELRLTAVNGRDKLALIRDNLFRRRFSIGMTPAEQSMRLALAAAQWIRGARVVRPRGTFQLNELADLVAADFGA